MNLTAWAVFGLAAGLGQVPAPAPAIKEVPPAGITLGAVKDVFPTRSRTHMLDIVYPEGKRASVSHVELTAGVGAGLAFAYTELAVVVIAAYVIGTHVLHLARPSVGALMNTVGLANTGYLGVPLVAALIGGSEAIGQSITYDLTVSAPMLLVTAFGIGAAFGTRAGDTFGQRLRAFARNQI